MCQIFQGDRQPPLAGLDAGNAVDSPQNGEANSLTLRFRLKAKPVEEAGSRPSGNRCRLVPPRLTCWDVQPTIIK